MAPQLPETKARQGRRGTPVLIVLIAALILGGIVWIIAEIYGLAIRPANPVGSPATMPNASSSDTVPAGKAPNANGTPKAPDKPDTAPAKSQ